MLYTGRGDDGTTKTFGCDQRISKSSAIAEALGALDEVNSFLGLCKVKAEEVGYALGRKSFAMIVHRMQENLFIVQAELAGAGKTLLKAKITELERSIHQIQKELPPIRTFFISGGSELAALCDIARTLSRRAERRVVAVAEAKTVSVGKHTLAYLNRLSSGLYALARLSNYLAGISEKPPSYT